jgi:putative toxin-antitoxin system antitoxin component (TIGR02293 family)
MVDFDKAKGDLGVVPSEAWLLGHANLINADVEDRIRFIREGMTADFVRGLIKVLQVPQRELFEALNISAATFRRRAKYNQPLSSSDSERILGVARLVGLVSRMVEESGDCEGFDAAEWVGRWLRRPHRALGGKRPSDYLDTMDGQSFLFMLLQRQQSGAFS